MLLVWSSSDSSVGRPCKRIKSFPECLRSPYLLLSSFYLWNWRETCTCKYKTDVFPPLKSSSLSIEGSLLLDIGELSQKGVTFIPKTFFASRCDRRFQRSNFVNRELEFSLLRALGGRNRYFFRLKSATKERDLRPKLEKALLLCVDKHLRKDRLIDPLSQQPTDRQTQRATLDGIKLFFEACSSSTLIGVEIYLR